MHLRLKLIILSALFACQGTLVYAQDNAFFQVPVPDSVMARMQGVSLPVAEAARYGLRRDDLRYLRLLHYDFDGHVREGEMVCNAAIADDLIDIFKRLFEAKYPIASVRLIDDFGADDERSMRANNTSCFCFRAVAGTKKLSKHARGLAVDLNPLQNPCVKTRKGRTVVQPSTATRFTNRSRKFAHKIDRNDLAYRLFLEHGFTWGGSWRSLKDYQHFER